MGDWDGGWGDWELQRVQREWGEGGRDMGVLGGSRGGWGGSGRVRGVGPWVQRGVGRG